MTHNSEVVYLKKPPSRSCVKSGIVYPTWSTTLVMIYSWILNKCLITHDRFYDSLEPPFSQIDRYLGRSSRRTSSPKTSRRTYSLEWSGWLVTIFFSLTTFRQGLWLPLSRPSLPSLALRQSSPPDTTVLPGLSSHPRLQSKSPSRSRLSLPLSRVCRGEK